MNHLKTVLLFVAVVILLNVAVAGLALIVNFAAAWDLP